MDFKREERKGKKAQAENNKCKEGPIAIGVLTMNTM